MGTKAIVPVRVPILPLDVSMGHVARPIEESEIEFQRSMIAGGLLSGICDTNELPAVYAAVVEQANRCGGFYAHEMIRAAMVARIAIRRLREECGPVGCRR